MIGDPAAPNGRIPSSGFALIAANVVPIFGVLFAGWDTFSIVFLYWLETAVIGALTILRMLTASGGTESIMRAIAESGRVDLADKKELLDQAAKKMGNVMGGGAKFFLVPFFCVHFGIFMAVHLVFITVLLGGGGKMPGPGFSPLGTLGSTFGQPNIWLLVSVLGLVGSHLYSYFTNYIGKGEYRRTAAPLEMKRPYGRVVVMHLAILFGAFVTMALGSSLAILVLLVVGKTVIDLKFHLREHRKRMAEPYTGESPI